MDGFSMLHDLAGTENSQIQSGWAIQDIIDNTIMKQMPLIMEELSESSETERLKKELEHRQNNSLKKFSKEHREGLTFLQRYQQETHILRQ